MSDETDRTRTLIQRYYHQALEQAYDPATALARTAAAFGMDAKMVERLVQVGK